MSLYFEKPLQLFSNPEDYDWDHLLLFFPDGRIRFEHGDGQAMRFEAGGNYQIYWQTEDQFYAIISGVRVDYQYRGDDDDGWVPSFELECNIEAGFFACFVIGPWRVDDEADREIFIYSKRFRFERDPLGLDKPFSGFEGRPPEEILENPQPWYFYSHDDLVRCPRRELPTIYGDKVDKFNWFGRGQSPDGYWRHSD